MVYNSYNCDVILNSNSRIKNIKIKIRSNIYM